MLWNLVILAITIILVILNVIIFKSFRDSKRLWLKRTVKTVGLILLIPWLLAISPNVLFLFSPLTPAVNGRIVDAETKKPLSNIRIKTAWYREHASPWGAAKARYKLYDITSDHNGEFRIPRTVKTLTLFIPPVIASYGGIYIFAYDHDYYWRSGISVIPSEVKPADTIEIAMQPVKSDKEFLDTIGETYLQFTWLQRNSITEKEKLTHNDWNYLVDAHRMFDLKYPNSNWAEYNLLKLNSVYREMGNYEAAINTLEKMINKYPSGEYAEYAKKEAIADLKTNMKKGEQK